MYGFPSSLSISFLKLKPNATFIDACAGAGGKTLHAAALMQNKGRIIAMDIVQNKLNELHKRAARQGFKDIETRLIDSEKVIRALKNSADAVLLDIYKNRLVELAFQGFRLEDSRRFNRPGPGVTGSERNRNFFPYPRTERDNNTSTPADPGV